FGNVGEDAAIDKVSPHGGEHSIADAGGELGSGQSGDKCIDALDPALAKDMLEVAHVGGDDFDVAEVPETIAEDFDELFVALDGDECRVGLQFVNDLLGDSAGARAEFDDDFGMTPVNFANGGARHGDGGGPDGGDLHAMLEEFAHEEEVFI